MADEPVTGDGGSESVDKQARPDGVVGDNRTTLPQTVIPPQQRPVTSTNVAPNLMNTGPAPVMQPGLTFSEIGQTGLRAFAGWVKEDFLLELQGRQGAQKYREMRDNSPIIGAVMHAIESTMRKVEWRVLPVDDSGEAQEAADFVDSCRDDMSTTWEDLVVENLSMLTYGYAPHEIVYKRRLGKDPKGTGPDGFELPSSDYDDGQIGWRRIPLRGQDTILKWFFDPFGQVNGVTQLPWTGMMKDIPIEKMLLFRPSAHKGNPEGRSILRNSYLSYYFLKRLQEQEAILGERMGGLPVVKIPAQMIEAANAGDSEASAAYQTFKKMATNVRVDEQMGAVIPSDTWPGPNGPSAVPMFALELLTPQAGRGTAMNFETAITRYNTNILTSVLADFLTLGHEARGTQSLAVTKVDMFFQGIEGWLNSMAGIYDRYALPRLWRLNGRDLDLMPKIEPDLAQRVDLDVLSNFVLRLAQSGMPLFPDDELQTFLRDAAGMPDVSDPAALQAAGLLDSQLEQQDLQQEARTEQMINPTPPVAQPVKPAGGSPLQKMILASLARRMIQKAGPRFGIHTARPRKVNKHYPRRRV